MKPAALLLVMALFSAVPAFAEREHEQHAPFEQAGPEEKERFLYGGVLGDVNAAKTSNTGPIHVLGGFGVSNADFVRGAFDGIPQGFDTLTFPLNVSAVFELARERRGAFRGLSLTVGTANNVSSDPPPGLAPGARLEHWYESDHFISLATELPAGWIGAATYSVFASPNGLGSTAQELTLAARYTGKDGLFAATKPLIKLAVPTRRGDGAFAAVSAAPSFPLGSAHKLALPVTLGLGMSDYYGPGTGSTGYASVGLSYSIPLGGAWHLSAGVDAVYRADKLAALGGPFADHDHLIWDGAVLVKFVY